MPPRSASTHAFLADIAHNAVPNGLADGDIEIGLRQPRQRPGGLRQRTARRPLHRRRRPRQREHRPDRRPPRVPLRAQPAGRAHQGVVLAIRATCAFVNEWLDAIDLRSTNAFDRRGGVQPGRRAGLGRRAPVPGGASSAPRCSTSTSCSRNSPARSSRTSTSSWSRRLRRRHRSGDRRRVRACGLSLRPLDADRDDRPVRPDLHQRPDRPDRGLPQSARVRRRRHDRRRQHRRRRHHPRHDPPGRQRDRRVRHQRAAQQPARPAARSRDDQSRARPRHRRAVAQRGARANSTRPPTTPRLQAL